jgi:hypothetical protein
VRPIVLGQRDGASHHAPRDSAMGTA